MKVGRRRTNDLARHEWRADIIMAGLAGLIIGVSVYFAASALSARIPILVQGTLSVTFVFAIALGLSLFEIPMMVFGLRQVAHSSGSRLFLVGTFGFFVGFASVYASMFILLTGIDTLGMGLVMLCGVRFVSGVFIS
jgi:hypothetical protein